MRLVVDANVLFASLIKNNLTRVIMLKRPFSLYSPSYVVEELFEHLDELVVKTNVNSRILKGKIKELLRLSDIKLVESEEFEDFLEKAAKISKDPDDVAYIALALKLKEQNKVKVYSTGELVELLE